MLEEVDEDVDLEPVPPTPGADAPSSYQSSQTGSSNRDSLRIPPYQTARTSRSSSASTSSDGISFVGSPTPADKLATQASGGGGLLNNRHSLDVNVGNSTRVSLDFESASRPSIDSEASRPSFDSIRPLPAAIKPVPGAKNIAGPLVKLSTASSLFTLSSTHSSPCPRSRPAAEGGKKRLLMLTGNRLPRAPMIAAPTFKKQDAGTQPGKESTSPVQGRVKELKTSWEERLSPKKDDTTHCERFVNADAPC